MNNENNHNGDGPGIGPGAVGTPPDGLRIWSHDADRDEITEVIRAVPQAPDVKSSGNRSTRMSPNGVKTTCDLYLAALAEERRRVEVNAPEPVDIPDGLEAGLERAMTFQQESGNANEDAATSLAETRSRVRAFDRTFPSADDEPGRLSPRRLGNLWEVLVVFFVAAAESAMAYFGLTLAAPKTDVTSVDPIQQLLAAHGPEMLAVGVGLLSALVTVRVAKELALAMAARHTVNNEER